MKTDAPSERAPTQHVQHVSAAPSVNPWPGIASHETYYPAPSGPIGSASLPGGLPIDNKKSRPKGKRLLIGSAIGLTLGGLCCIAWVTVASFMPREGSMLSTASGETQSDQASTPAPEAEDGGSVATAQIPEAFGIRYDMTLKDVEILLGEPELPADAEDWEFPCEAVGESVAAKVGHDLTCSYKTSNWTGCTRPGIYVVYLESHVVGATKIDEDGTQTILSSDGVTTKNDCR